VVDLEHLFKPVPARRIARQVQELRRRQRHQDEGRVAVHRSAGEHEASFFQREVDPRGEPLRPFLGSATPCASTPPWPSIFSDYSFWFHHPVNQDDRHLLAHAMASDFSVA
jgi:hypothetical protein